MSCDEIQILLQKDESKYISVDTQTAVQMDTEEAVTTIWLQNGIISKTMCNDGSARFTHGFILLGLTWNVYLPKIFLIRKGYLFFVFCASGYKMVM